MKRSIGMMAASALVLTTTAFAQNAKGPVAGKVNMNDQQRAEAAAFWTDDTLANATPMPLPKVDPLSLPTRTDSAVAVTTGARGALPGGLPTYVPSIDAQPKLNPITPKQTEVAPATIVQPEGFSYEMPFTNHRSPLINEYPYSTVGKLFFTIPAGASEPAGTYVCSASVAVNSHTLVTARHCMFDYSTGKWYSNWVFYPAYNNGGNAAYHGGWTIRTAATWTSGASGWDYDIGLMQVNDDKGYGCNGSSGGRPIGSYTGWLGSTWNGDYSQRQWDIFGYPQAAPFAGGTQWQDEAGTGVINPFGTTNIVEVGNPQTGGTSGGPWIIGLSPANDDAKSNGNNVLPASLNLINGVNSFKWTSPDHSNSINGPAFFTYNFYNLYTYYAGLSCP